jgi:hypothetical protein
MVSSARLRRKVEVLGLAAEGLFGPAISAEKSCLEVLATPDGGEDFLAGASALNSDGVPLQLCLSSSHGGTDLRLIGDPGTHCGDLEARDRCSRTTLDRCVRMNASDDISPLVNTTLAHLLPQSAEERARYLNGFLWIAVSPGRPGVAFYAELAPLGEAAGWQKVEQWLGCVLPQSRISGQVLAALRRHAVPASAGLEGRSKDDLRVKIYFRLKQTLPLDRLGIDLFADGQVAEFLRMAMGNFGVDRDGLVLCVGFSVATGELADVKVDLCGHCLAYAEDEWPRVVSSLTSRWDLAPLPVEDALKKHGCKVAFLGFGLDSAGNRRLNLYLNAAEPRQAPLAGEIRAALTDGVRYLRNLQNEDGYWTDFDLPVGASSEWITAYVGLALARAARQGANREAVAAAERAALWLSSQRSYEVGWGYNGKTGPDSDSTAIAIGLLRELGQPIRPEDQALLRERWQPEGGLATYSGPGAWGVAHWDVTPIGYLGLSPADQTELRPSFLAALQESRMPSGMWRAYWWRNPYYSTFSTLEALEELGIEEPAQVPGSSRMEVDNAFDLACAIGIHGFRTDWTQRSVNVLRGLLSWQQADGGWPGHPNLRVTEDSCFEPWVEPAGEYYSDNAATLTTATVIRVLSLLLARQPVPAIPLCC